MKRYAMLGVLALTAAIMGCEFEGSGDSGSWNSARYGWVNFSGVYKASGGGIIVSSFTSGSGSGSIGSTNFVNVTGEKIGQGNGVDTTFNGVLNRAPILPGSLSISAGGFDLTDNGSGSMSGGGATGAIDYGTGAWSIDLLGIPLGAGVSITADYSYTVSVGDDPGGGSGSQGSSGKGIYSFTVFQTGNKLEILDNNGAKYYGRMGGVSTTSGINGGQDETVIPAVGDAVVAEFTAEGTSAAGVNVMLSGTFQGVVGRSGDESAAMFLTDRRMLGTWVEDGGVTGDINGRAAPIGIAVPAADAPAADAGDGVGV